jgi:hypothetical protein
MRRARIRSALAGRDAPAAVGGDHTTVDEHVGAGDEGGVRAGQEVGRRRDVVGGAAVYGDDRDR